MDVPGYFQPRLAALIGAERMFSHTRKGRSSTGMDYSNPGSGLIANLIVIC
jgi:hypothetical protein